MARSANRTCKQLAYSELMKFHGPHLTKSVKGLGDSILHSRIYEIQMFMVATFASGFDKYQSFYDGDYHLRKNLLKDEVVERVSENYAII